MGRNPARLSWLLIFLSFTFLTLGIASLLGVTTRLKSTRVIHFESAKKSFGHVTAGASVSMTFNLINPTDQTIHILGGSKICHASACVEVDGLPLTIPSRSRKIVRLTVLTMSPAHLSASFPLYTDSEDCPELMMRIEGEIDAKPVANLSSRESL